MKRVRFETPLKVRDTNIMNYETDCHSPRPYIDKGIKSIPSFQRFDDGPRLLPYSNDPIQRFEFGNSSPYATVKKTLTSVNFPTVGNQQAPSSDLDLSVLDYTCQEPRKQPLKIFSDVTVDACLNVPNILNKNLTNKTNLEPPNVLRKGDDFFLKREQLGKLKEVYPLCEQVNKLSLEKENNPLVKKAEIMKLGSLHKNNIIPQAEQETCVVALNDNYCKCHHCVKISAPYQLMQACTKYREENQVNQFCCRSPDAGICPHSNYNMQIVPPQPKCNCQNKLPNNSVDKKNWALEKYEQSKRSECLDLEQQNTIVKEKREPTVTDLYKIIKLQNEQLQLLQEKVDKFIAANRKENNQPNPPLQNYVTEHVTLKSVDSEEHKISIGVMTSFEMVRTSTVINKEVIKQSEAQIQCNRSQISIKEVVSKAQPVNINFLDGISKKNDTNSSVHNSTHNNDEMTRNTGFEDKTFNELSLYNVQVDNATTPMMSPEQSMYLDVKDYSDSDTESDDPSNVGWTYYNKVMTRVNGMLQDSDMPSSASALYRNARQKCLMQIDKTNVSVTKRVTFGENPIQMQPPQMTNATTDTSLKMNQLAAKYLQKGQQASVATNKPTASAEMSFATKNYMERHKLLQGNHIAHSQPPPKPQQEIPKFLDITVLKQQPKLL
ncbi:uncharacterized protein LOC119830241 [Zerene cesonia]|uniref:uncharacterized protein LOC119830241 n=1 Tax=Zerene cesonia TaxID=33412 RepID=UPI0018E4DB42|nr:uncharacterized protein LOC119830241 [Zerene cesonia]